MFYVCFVAVPRLSVGTNTVIPAQAGTHAELATQVQYGFPPARQ
jgi:hypothetical protein